MTDSQCRHISKVVPQDGNLFAPYVINCIVMTLLSLTAIIGNILILVSICRAPQFLRKPSYVLLLNLAFADLCVGLFAEPAYLFYKMSYLLNPYSLLSCHVGVAFNFLSYFLSSLSLWTAAVISLDRLMALHLHMKYNAIVTKFRVFVLIVSLLILSLVFASMFKWALDAQNTVFVCLNSLALLIALLSYIRIFQIVRYHQKQISIQLSELSFASQRNRNDCTKSSGEQQDDCMPEQLQRDGNQEIENAKRSGNQENELKMKGIEEYDEKSSVSKEILLQHRKIATRDSLENATSKKPFFANKDVRGKQQRERKCTWLNEFSNEKNAASQRVETTQGNSNKEFLGFVSSSSENRSHSGIGSRIPTPHRSMLDHGSSEQIFPTGDLEITMIENEALSDRRLDPKNKNKTVVGEDETLKKQTAAKSNGNVSQFRRCLGNCFESDCGLTVGKTPMIKAVRYQTKTTETTFQRSAGQNEYQNYYHCQNENLPKVNSEGIILNQENDEEMKLHTPSDKQYFKQINKKKNFIKDETNPTMSQAGGENDESVNTELLKRLGTRGVKCKNDTLGQNPDRNLSKRRKTKRQVTGGVKNGFKMQHFKKSVFNMFVIWFLMLLCYLPLICTSILVNLLGRSYSIHLAFNFTTSVMFVNSSVNPIVFCWRIREFRAAVRKTLTDVFGFWEHHNVRNANLSSLAI